LTIPFTKLEFPYIL